MGLADSAEFLKQNTQEQTNKGCRLMRQSTPLPSLCVPTDTVGQSATVS